MSHTMSIQTEIRDLTALEAACKRLELTTETGTFKLFQTTEEGTAIHFEGWKYPAVVKNDGTVAYDDYNGRWGDVGQLNELTAYYGLEKAKMEARKKGYSIYERSIDNGNIQQLELKIRMG